MPTSEPVCRHDEDHCWSNSALSGTSCPTSASPLFYDDPEGPRLSVAGGDGRRYLVELGEGILGQVQVSRRYVLL